MNERMITVRTGNIRIDKVLAEECGDLTRSYLQKLIADGSVLVNGKSVKSNYKANAGDEVKLIIPEPELLDAKPQDIELAVMYEDEDLIVVDKPQGMVVHPAAGNYDGTLVNALLHHTKGNLSQINGVIRPGIVHRIDKDTSGILVVAKNNESHLALSKQIKDHTVTRKYIAIVHGNIKNDTGTIDAPIGRSRTDRKKMAVTEEQSRKAVTHFKVLERFGNYTFAEFQLETGRTHQIRVHTKYMGNPVLGDPVYGPAKNEFGIKGQMLHAKLLGFIHPATGEYMEFETDMPERFRNILDKLKKVERSY